MFCDVRISVNKKPNGIHRFVYYCYNNNTQQSNPTKPNTKPSKIATMPCSISHIKNLLAALLWIWHASMAWGYPSTTLPTFAGWVDAQGTATVETVQQQAQWQSFVGWKGWGFGPEPVWVRIQVPAVKPNAPPWVLIVRPPFLDQVTFYDPTFGVKRRAGDNFTATDDALGSVLFTFEIPAQNTTRDVFVKLQSTSSRVIHLSLLPLHDAQYYTRTHEWSTGFVLVLSLVFFVWAFMNWLLTREPMIGVFSIKQFFSVLWGFIFLGFARLTLGPLLSEGTLSLIGNILGAGFVASTLLFLATLLVDYQARVWMLRVIYTTVALVPGLAFLNLLGYTQLFLQIINTLVPILLLWVTLTLLTAPSLPQNPHITKAALLSYLSLYCLLNSLPAFIYIGLIQESFFLFIGYMGVMVLDGLVMLVILTVRQRRSKELHQAITTQLMLQQEQARLDQQYLDEQRKLLAMLAHEMKTPLANLRIWMEAGPKGRPVMERAIVDMGRVIERCVHAGQLSDHSLKPCNEWLDAAELTQSILDISRQPSRVQLALPADVCPALVDAQMLSIVLSNVLENAYKYSDTDTSIELSLAPHSSADGRSGWRWYFENTVGDAGIPSSDKVFNKYYRGANAQRKSGSGLGLFLVKSLVELMHGTVSYTPLIDRVRLEVWVPMQGDSPQSTHETVSSD